MFRSGYCARSWDTVVLGDYRRHTVRQLQLTLMQALYYCSISWSNIEVVWCGVGFCFFEDPGSGHRSVRWQWCYSINSTRNCRHVHLPPRFARRYISQRSSFINLVTSGWCGERGGGSPTPTLPTVSTHSCAYHTNLVQTIVYTSVHPKPSSSTPRR